MDVRILGTLEAVDAGRPIDLGLRQARMLLGVLALQPGTPVRVSRIAEVLWPQGPPARWEATVQSHISRLRRALEPDRAPRAPSRRISTRGDAYVLNVDDNEIDARRFERLAAAGRSALARGDHATAEDLLGRALAEWRGPVLADLDGSLPIAAEAGRLEELRLLAVEERAEAVIAIGDHARAVADLEGLVLSNPLRERGWELLLLALYRSGRQAEALRRYQELRALLVGELGIEPGPSLRALEGAILRQDSGLEPRAEPLAAGSTGQLPLPTWLRSPSDTFVGRVREVDAAHRADRLVREGHRRLVLVVGEPGIGKTRLVREVSRELHDAGSLVVGGRCAEDTLYVLQPFAAALERLARSRVDALGESSSVERAALAALMPDLLSQERSIGPIDPETQRYLVYRSVGALLDAGAHGRPVVLVLDDLQWAAQASLTLLAHILGDEERGPLLVLATMRDTETNEALDALLADLHRERRLEKIPLSGLAPEEVEELAASRGYDVPADALFEMTEGNPFFVEELVRHAVEVGGDPREAALPDSVRDTIARRLLRLSDVSRRLLGMAAVCGGEFRLDVVARAAAIDVEAADDALTGAVSAGIVRPVPRRPGVYEFSHALVRAVLSDGLGAARRVRVHRRVGEAARAVGAPGSEVARHLLVAAADDSELEPGVRAALAAARSASARHAYEDAIAVLRLANETLSARPLRDPRLGCAVLVALAEASRGSGAYEGREEVLEQAWTLATATDDPDLMAEVVSEGMSGWVLPPEPWPDRAESACARLPDSSSARAVLTSVLSRVHARHDSDRARQMAEWALARVPSIDVRDRPTVIIYCLSAIGAFSAVERVADLTRSAVEAARASGDAVDILLSLSQLRLAHLAAGDLESSDRAGREYEDLVGVVGIPRYRAGVEQRRAMRALLAGRFVEAEAHANEAVRLQPTTEFIEALAVQLFALRLEQGRLDEVRGAVEAWAARDERAAWQIGLSTLLAESGDTTMAAEVLDKYTRSGFESVPRDDLYFLSLGAAATTAVLTGDREAAGVLYELLSPHSARVIVAAEGALCWGSIHRLLGPLSAALGNTERASMHFEAAISVHERLGALPFLARDRLAYATELRAACGDRVRVENLARTGLALASQLGMRAVIERYERGA